MAQTDQAVNALPIKLPELRDYLMGIGADQDDEEYRLLISELAKKIVEDYEGSVLAGSARSVKDAIDDIAENAAGTHYGVCQTAAGSASKTVSCEGFKLETGAQIIVLFSATNTASGMTLNVNGTGGREVWYKGTRADTGAMKGGCAYLLVYDGSRYRISGELDTWKQMSGATSASDGTAGYVPVPPRDGYNTKFLRADGTYAVPPDTKYQDMVGATPSAAGTHGLVPAPPSQNYNKAYLRADGTFTIPPNDNTTDLTQMTGVLPINKGGTGGISAENARQNLGLGELAVKNSLTAGEVGALPLHGTADKAGKLHTPASIDGVDYDGSGGIEHYAVCTTDAATAAKTVELEGMTSLKNGAKISVRFTVTNTATPNSLYLKVGSLEARAIRWRNAYLPAAGYLAANRTYDFIYDGTYWQVCGDMLFDYTTVTDDMIQTMVESAFSEIFDNSQETGE